MEIPLWDFENGLTSLMMESMTITLPNKPTITVHKGWTPLTKRGNKTVLTLDQPRFETHAFSIRSRKGEPSTAKPPEEASSLISQAVPAARLRKTGQQFDFVNNACEPLHTKDVAVRKLVRSHAMREVCRERREQKKKLEDEISRCDQTKEIHAASQREPEQISKDAVEAFLLARGQSIACGSSDRRIEYCFTNYLSRIHANIHRLETQYFTQLGSAIFPMEFHLAYDPPMQLWKLDPSFTDDAVYQSLMYAAAVCSTLADGRRNSDDVPLQMSMTIGLINKLLNVGMVGDGMLGAVSHLAMGEALRGNFDAWVVHMNGLKSMVEMRGGMDKIHAYLRMKLYRADLMGSIDQVSRPFFHFDKSHHPTIDTTPRHQFHDTSLDLPAANVEIQTLLPRSAKVLTELFVFSRVIEQTILKPEARLDPKVFIEAWYSIHYQLLSTKPVEETSDGDLSNDDDKLEDAFRLGAMIYMKEILREFTFPATGSETLVSQLETALSPVFRSEVAPFALSLLLWLLIMGGVACVKSSVHRVYFVALLVQLRRRLGYGEWEDVRERLNSVLWIGGVLDRAGQALWEEVRLRASG